MIGAVIDCSAVVDLLSTGGSQAVREHAELADCILAAPHLIDPEFLSAMRRLARQHPERREHVERVLLDYGDLTIMRFEHTPLRRIAWRWRNELTAYDAMYVALARELRLPLVTSDARLAAVAQRWCDARLLRDLVAS